jgi:hypothetical protein
MYFVLRELLVARRGAWHLGLHVALGHYSEVATVTA